MTEYEYEDQNDPSGNLVWRVDDSGANVLVNTLTGREVKRVPPVFLPDGTLMQTLTLFRVESTKDFMFKGVAEIKQGDFLIAKKLPDGEIALFTNTQTPFVIKVGAKVGVDFNFVSDLSKLKDGDLKLKLKRVLEIENYEYAVKIREEMKSRNLAVEI